MKKIILTSLVAVAALASQAAFADDTTICARDTKSHSGVTPASGTAGTHFMVSPITPKCSANVYMEGSDGTAGAWYAVAANSNKGKNTYGGSTAGATVQTACSTAGACTTGEVGTAKTAVNTGS